MSSANSPHSSRRDFLAGSAGAVLATPLMNRLGALGDHSETLIRIGL